MKILSWSSSMNTNVIQLMESSQLLMKQTVLILFLKNGYGNATRAQTTNQHRPLRPLSVFILPKAVKIQLMSIESRPFRKYLYLNLLSMLSERSLREIIRKL